MDPLSIIASIAGIATAGTSLSKAIYHFISSTRGASREMADIARNISDLSCILSELRRVLQESADICSRKLLRRIKSATRRISTIHDDIYGLMDRVRGFQTLRWSLKRSEVQYKLTLIESHKTAIQLMLNILILAATTRKEAQPQVTQTASTSEGKQKEAESEVPLLRQQSENLAYAASHCLVDLSENQEFDAGQPKTDPDSDNDDATVKVQIRGHGTYDGTGRWLFELVFESYTKACQVTDTKGQNIENEHGLSTSDSTAVVVRTPAELQIAIYNPGEGQHLVDILLADWICLSEREITAPLVRKPEKEESRPSSPIPAQSAVPCIRFRDAINRKYTFPYSLVHKWEGMQELIRQAFVQIEAIYPHILAGQYFLNGPDGNMIHPLRWKSTVEPGMQVVMVMSIPQTSYPEKVKTPTRRQDKHKSKYITPVVFNPKRIF
ncbi:hypothetical protein FPANT_5777 [Fusarium pseudoanthophilum]|uniref:Ubiquitin-like domain-containing protein n=1 Tax=Fusarium pseudoanthophilum TaxID=48495 RepID=A0A8H5P6N9_9HYPO|nr:hypothetical protein FPANT_5777 [Fusarium pseudoanthophilum]